VEKWVDSKVAANHLDKDSKWLTNNVQRLRIPHSFVGRQYRFKLSELDSWANGNSSCVGNKGAQ
jgi:hypothetical protein